MALDCYCDYDPPDIHSSRMVKGRKSYACFECRARINVGDRHEYAFAVYDGCAFQYRTCLHCLAIRKFVSLNIPCWCWCYGSMLDDAKEIVAAAYFEAPDEVRGVRFGLGRLLVKARRERRHSWQVAQ